MKLPGLGVARVVLHAALLHLVDRVLQLLEIRLKTKAFSEQRNFQHNVASGKQQQQDLEAKKLNDKALKSL